ncbi:hypothetical protein NDU88_010776 [Pleurodeles waltl]|uniref:Uncharacterized protein n=1 Tax=Pleurodeles waltl TaxID=8319 RepID=A0AAV7S098_PLEWA|nr:hypothetical protein NDU88_010776 [Pleurodeles waltl]
MSVVKTPAMSSGRLFPNANTCMFVGRSAGRGCDRLLYTSMAIKFMDAPVSTNACVGEPLTMTVHVGRGGASRAAAAVALGLRVAVRSSRTRAKERVPLLGGSGAPAAARLSLCAAGTGHARTDERVCYAPLLCVVGTGRARTEKRVHCWGWGGPVPDGGSLPTALLSRCLVAQLSCVPRDCLAR